MSGIGSYLVFFLIQALIFAVVCLGLNLQWGYTGLFNIGVSGFFLVGAYAFAILCGPTYADHLGGFGLPFVAGLAGAIFAAALIAAIVAVPVLRLHEDYLAIVTIGIGSILQLIALNTPSLTGGSRGVTSIPRLMPGVLQSVFGRNLLMLALLIAVVGIIYGALEAMVRSPWGRVLKAIREDEVAASSLGKSPFSFRLQAFVLGCAIMGMGGALYASFIGFISPEDFLPILTFQVWTMLIVGGSGNNKGAILGAVLMWGVWTLTGSVALVLPIDLQVKGGAAQIILIGLLLMLTLILRPRGLLGEEAVVSGVARVEPRGQDGTGPGLAQPGGHKRQGRRASRT